MIRGKVDNYFAGIPWVGIAKHGDIKGHRVFLSNSNSSKFNHYAGKTHEQLLNAWNGGRPTLTTCNGLAGLMFNRLFAGKKKGINGLSFDIDVQCTANAPLAWFSQTDNPDARPGYGDIVLCKPPKLHSAICLGADQATWQVIQSGQGGKSVGADIIAKGRATYPVHRIVGWINVAILWDYDEIRIEHEQIQKEWDKSPFRRPGFFERVWPTYDDACVGGSA
jgi:hypothetical protein